jgi:dTDP-3-amino-3,4,6-trideoxy-alpha-D-glucose transaminase
MIQLNEFSRQWIETRESALAAIDRVGRSGQYILGKEVAALESKLAALWEKKSAVTVGNGTDALEIALRALECGPGDKVLTTPLSAFATTLAIVKTGATPVFADTDGSGGLDLDCCERILEKDPSIKYCVPVHLYGHALNLPKLQKLKEKFGLKIVEDCAQAVGARFGGRLAGSVGLFSTTSFYPTKNLGAMGDGGALMTDSDQLASQALMLREYGQRRKFFHEKIGLNSRLDEIQAALLLDAQLPRLGQWNSARLRIARRYLGEMSNPGLSPIVPGPGAESVWHLFPVLAPKGKRESFQAHLESRGICSSAHYPALITEQPALRGYGKFEIPQTLERASEIAARVVTLPIHPYLNDDEVSRIVEAVQNWDGGTHGS